MAAAQTIRAMRVTPTDRTPKNDLHLIIMGAPPGTGRPAAPGIRHENAYDAATTYDHTPLSALAVIVGGRPPGRPGSPFDAGPWIRTYFAVSDGVAVSLLHGIRRITGGRVYRYTRFDDAGENEKMRRAEYRICGIAAQGWRVWTGTPRPRAIVMDAMRAGCHAVNPDVNFDEGP